MPDTGADAKAHSEPVVRADMLYVKRNSADAVPTRLELFECHADFLELDTVSVQNVRQSNLDFSLATTGFQFERMPLPLGIDFADDNSVTEKYFPDLEQFLRKQLGASSVKAFHHKYRDQKPGGPYGPNHGGPAKRPHVDVTSTFAPILFSWIHPELYKDVIAHKRRWHMLTVWRPLKTVRRDPLALLDATSVGLDDFLTIQQPDRGPEVTSWFLQKSSGHRWWYMAEQTPEELLLFLQHDSEGGPVVPHASISLPTSSEEARESIEVRVVVVY
ncbi:unnamed protein product [Discula destructiva]